jgi:hypothetical protein
LDDSTKNEDQDIPVFRLIPKVIPFESELEPPEVGDATMIKYLQSIGEKLLLSSAKLDSLWSLKRALHLFTKKMSSTAGLCQYTF